MELEIEVFDKGKRPLEKNSTKNFGDIVSANPSTLDGVWVSAFLARPNFQYQIEARRKAAALAKYLRRAT